MPIYEYKCPKGHVFEVFQRMADAPVEVCEVCGEGPVERVLYPVAVHFKGSGFYSTDYGRASRRGGQGRLERRLQRRVERRFGQQRRVQRVERRLRLRRRIVCRQEDRRGLAPDRPAERRS